MESRDDIRNTQIITVSKEGRDVGFASFGEHLKKLTPSGFVAIDAEFSGLGNDPDIKDDNLETRYAAFRRIADTRAILSIGISIFDVDTNSQNGHNTSHGDGTQSNGSNKKITYKVATYDMLLCCQSEFAINADAGEFLVAHNFDFNEMFRKGIPYTRASTEKISEKEKLQGGDKSKWQWQKLPRGLLWRIGRQGVPLIVHNGLFDLVFLYAAFQGPLPNTLHGFICSLLECVPAGYWDSKVLATNAKERCSFLGYLFAKGVVQNQVFISDSVNLPSPQVTDPPTEQMETSKDILCALFSFRGFCPRGIACPFSHDPFAILVQDAEGKGPADVKEAYKRHKSQSKTLKRRIRERKEKASGLSKKQKRKQIDSNVTNNISATCQNENEKDTKNDDDLSAHAQDGESNIFAHEKLVHTAGWDAFCTGFVFASYRASMKEETLNKLRNQIALPYKLSTLHLARSKYAELDTVMSEPDTTKQ